VQDALLEAVSFSALPNRRNLSSFAQGAWEISYSLISMANIYIALLSAANTYFVIKLANGHWINNSIANFSTDFIQEDSVQAQFIIINLLVLIVHSYTRSKEK
jgi:hypothetical protein